MIPKAVIRAYLKRPLDDWSWYTALDDEQLNRRRDRLPVDPPIWNKLQRHQKQGLLLGIRLKKVAYWYDTGTGKTLMMLALMRYFGAKRTLHRALALVPNLVNKEEWAREIEKHCPEVSYLILEGSSKQKLEALRATKATVVIETYAGLVRLLSTMQPSTRKRRKPHLTPDPKLVTEASKLFNMIVIDESGAVGNRQSLTYRIVKKLAWGADYTYELNGTPFGRDPTPLWAQMYCVDHGDTLGQTLGLFRAAFFNELNNGFGNEYHFRKSMAGELRQMLRHRSLRCRADEADLPTTVRITKVVSLGEDAQIIYSKAQAALKQLHTVRGKPAIAIRGKRKGTFVRMRQVSSGFLGYEDDDTGKAAQYEFKLNPKLDLLIDLVGSVVDEYKAVVFNEFTFSGSLICRELDKLGIKYARIYGKTADPGAELRRFTESDSCRVLVLQSAAGGMGLNLQVAKYVFYYESPVSPTVRKQTEARVARQGSEHDRVFIYDLVARGVDQRILKFHAEGRSLLDAVLNGEDML